MSSLPEHKATEVKIETLPFYKSLQLVAATTGIDQKLLLRRQVGFRASPDRCISCGHEWNAFDAIINTVEQGPHDWDFFKPKLSGDVEKFFFRRMALKCADCTIQSDDVGILYNYQPTTWNSDLRYKEDVTSIGEQHNGINLYRFRYKGKAISYVGVIAQDLLEIAPKAVYADPHGYLSVDYDAIGLEFQTWEEWGATRSQRAYNFTMNVAK